MRESGLRKILFRTPWCGTRHSLLEALFTPSVRTCGRYVALPAYHRAVFWLLAAAGICLGFSQASGAVQTHALARSTLG